ncbi:MAG: type II toxin-antitoxin system VapC family toxin [Planctomycetota bacterium]|jgi:predicted nucleic acid-binding protein
MSLSTYLDSGVLIAACRGDREISEAALEVLADDEREFIISNYVKLETLPGAVYGGYSTQVEIYEEIFEICTLIETSHELTCDALEYAKKYGIGGADALHVTMAINEGADELITNEKETRPMFRVQEIKVTSLHSAA